MIQTVTRSVISIELKRVAMWQQHKIQSYQKELRDLNLTVSPADDKPPWNLKK